MRGLVKGLGRRQHQAGYSRPGLVDAIELPVAVIAENIALRGYRQMYPAELALDLGIEAGMKVNVYHGFDSF